jgi:hypothetical protein
MGATAGFLFSYWGSRALHAIADAGPLDLRPDGRVVGYMVGVAALTGIACGIAPAMRASRVDLSLAMSERGQAGSGRQVGRHLSRTLVAAQVALSLMLLVAAGLLIRSLYNLRHVDIGFRPDRVLIFDVAHNPRSLEPAALAGVATQVRDRVRQIPGVRSVSLSRIQLFSGSDLSFSLRISDYPARRPCERFPRHTRPRRGAQGVGAFEHIVNAPTVLVSRPVRMQSAGTTRSKPRRLPSRSNRHGMRGLRERQLHWPAPGNRHVD